MSHNKVGAHLTYNHGHKNCRSHKRNNQACCQNQSNFERYPDKEIKKSGSYHFCAMYKWSQSRFFKFKAWMNNMKMYEGVHNEMETKEGRCWLVGDTVKMD